VRHWEESNGTHPLSIEPISAALDEDLSTIVMAKELGMSVVDLEQHPSRDRWAFVLRTKWAWEDLERKRAAKRRK